MRVTNCELIANLETLGSNENVQVSYIKELYPCVNPSYRFLKDGGFSTSGASPSSRSTNESRFARMVNVQQVTVQVEMSVAAGLNGSVSRFAGGRAGGEVELCENCKWWERNARDALGGEFLGVHDDDFLDVWVRGLVPMGSERSHYWWCGSG